MTKGNDQLSYAERIIQHYFSKVFKIVVLITFMSNPSLAQSPEDTTDGRFHDDLLNHLVGKWNVTSMAHGSPFTAVVEVDWVMNHQYLHIHLKSNEVVPWFHVPMEFEEFIGYNHNGKRYVVHGMSIEGDEDPSEGFLYGYRTGNEFKTVAKFGVDSLIVQRFSWQTAYRELNRPDSWNIKSVWEIAGKEGEPFLEMQLVAVKPH